MGSVQRPQNHEIARNWMLGILVCAVALAILSAAAPISIPIFMAIFVAAVLRVPVRLLMKGGLPQPVSAAMVFVFAAVAAIALGASLYTPAAQWIGEMPKLVSQIERKLVPIKNSIEEAQDTAKKIESAADFSDQSTQPVVVREASMLERALATSRSLLAQIAVTFILAFFMLASPSPLIPPALTAHFGERGRLFRESLGEVETQMSRYMGAMMLINGAVGLLTASAMFLCGMPSPLLWGVLATVLGFVPYLGPIATAAIIGAVAFLTFDGWIAILTPVGIYLVIHLVESEFVTPLIMGRLMMLHPVAIFVFVLIWSWMWGLAGAFLAVPILVACVITGRNLLIDEQRTLSDMMLSAGGFGLGLGEEGPAQPNTSDVGAAGAQPALFKAMPVNIGEG